MIVDCKTCPVRGLRCDDCAVTVLGAPPSAGHRAPTGPGLSAGPAWGAEPAWSTEPVCSAEVKLDAAEYKVVSMFVGAGMVNAGAAARLLARRERVPSWESAREVG